MRLRCTEKELGSNGLGLEGGERNLGGTGAPPLFAGSWDEGMSPSCQWHVESPSVPSGLHLSSRSPFFSFVVPVAKRSLQTILWFLLRLERAASVME